MKWSDNVAVNNNRQLEMSMSALEARRRSIVAVQDRRGSSDSISFTRRRSSPNQAYLLRILEAALEVCDEVMDEEEDFCFDGNRSNRSNNDDSSHS